MQHILDHAIQPKPLAVLWRIHAADAVFLEQRYLLRQDDSASAREDTNVRGIPFTQPVDHVLEKLDVSSLIGGDRNGVCVFIQGCSYDLVNAAIVAEMDHLATVPHQQPADNIDARVMSVEQTGSRYEAQLSSFSRGRNHGRFGLLRSQHLSNSSALRAIEQVIRLSSSYITLGDVSSSRETLQPRAPSLRAARRNFFALVTSFWRTVPITQKHIRSFNGRRLNVSIGHSTTSTSWRLTITSPH